jgi:magnesium transporter
MTDTQAERDVEERLSHLRHALESGRVRRITRMLHSLHPAEIALMLEALPYAERELVWGLVDPDDHGAVLLHVSDKVREGLISGMDDEVLLAATEGLEMDDLADLVEDLPEAVTQQMLRSMDRDNRRRLEAVLSYPPDSAGGLMNTDTVTVRPDVSIEVVLRYMRLRGSLPQATDSLFVVDRYGRYLGVVGLQQLLTQDMDRPISDVMDTHIRPLEATKSAREVAKRFEDLDLISAPVVTEDSVLVGRITIDDVVDVIRDEAEHSIMGMAGLDEEEDVFAPVRDSVKRRAVWLGVKLVTALLASWVVGLFSGAISQLVALAVLMPVVAAMGGSGGSQTLTLMIRGLALGQIGSGNTRTLLAKEIALALINGVLWGVTTGIIAWVWFGRLDLAVVMAFAMIGNHLNGALVGLWLPLLFRKIHVDPAIAGNAMLTTVTDMSGFFIFLGLGSLFLL